MKGRVERLVDGIMTSGHEVANQVADMPGAHRGSVEQVRDLVEQNALRILGRFREKAWRPPPEETSGTTRKGGKGRGSRKAPVRGTAFQGGAAASGPAE